MVNIYECDHVRVTVEPDAQPTSGLTDDEWHELLGMVRDIHATVFGPTDTESGGIHLVPGPIHA
jgi:hypothetical protein